MAVSQIAEYTQTIPQKGQDPNPFDVNMDTLLLWIVNHFVSTANALASDVDALALAVEGDAQTSADAVMAITSKLLNAVQSLSDLDASILSAISREGSLEADITTAQAVQVLMDSNIASANLPSGVLLADAFNSMQVKADGSGWELPEHLTLTNGQLLKGGGVYGIKTGAGFTVPLTIPDMNMIGEIRLKWYSGSLKDYPVPMNLPAGTTMLGESSIEWGDENTSGLLIYKISSSEWGYELTYKTTTKVI